MADLSDVEKALVELVTNLVCPGSAVEPALSGTAIRVYRGWPITRALDADLRMNVSNISIFPIASTGQNTTRWGPVTQVTAGTKTLNVTVSGASATFSGTGGPTQLAGLLVANRPFIYAGKVGDTPNLVAAIMAELIQQTRACWLSGATVTVPGVTSVLGRVVANGSMSTEWSRQTQDFRMSVWCPDPSTRDMICARLGAVFSSMSFLTLPDGSSGRIRYRGTSSFDDDRDGQQYRRDLIYSVEYGTSIVESAPAMLFGDLVWAGSSIYH